MPFDMKPKPQAFLMPCVEREHPKDGTPRCKRLGQELGMSYGVYPDWCATCMLSGKQDEAFLKNHVVRILTKELHRAYLGFYKNEEDIETLFVKVVTLGQDEKTKATLARALQGLVELKRISLKKAEELATKHLPELINESSGQVKSSGGTIKNAS